MISAAGSIMPAADEEDKSCENTPVFPYVVGLADGRRFDEALADRVGVCEDILRGDPAAVDRCPVEVEDCGRGE